MAALRRRYIYNPEKWFNSSSGFSSIGKYENRKKSLFHLKSIILQMKQTVIDKIAHSSDKKTFFKKGGIMSTKSILPELIGKYEGEILKDWMKEQLASVAKRMDLISESELEAQSSDFLRTLQEATAGGEIDNITGSAWLKARNMLKSISKSRSVQGFTPSETATFIFSLKQPLFSLVQREKGDDPKVLAYELWVITVLLDKLGLFTAEHFLKGREAFIKRQQDEMLELSTPVVKLWEGILVLPLIGTLDSTRTQVVMENLLRKIVETSSGVAIIDITGVPTVDTIVAQHLMKTVSAARLMGADCIISGIRPQIAQTMVHLGVTFTDIMTKATLSDAVRYSFSKTGLKIVRMDKTDKTV
jgi:rsbT co-antagonist protein RsbR